MAAPSYLLSNPRMSARLSLFTDYQKSFNLTNFDDSLSCISFLLDKYILNKDFELLNFINFLIENYYYKLSLANSNNVTYYILKKNKILYLINDMKKYNLDKKNLIILINNILYSEKK